MTSAQRQQLRTAVDQHKRAEIAKAHGRPIDWNIRKLNDCEYCGALIEHTRRFCDQTCINAARKVAPAHYDEIRRRLAAGERGVDLAAEYGMSARWISDIKHRKGGR